MRRVWGLRHGVAECGVAELGWPWGGRTVLLLFVGSCDLSSTHAHTQRNTNAHSDPHAATLLMLLLVSSSRPLRLLVSSSSSLVPHPHPLWTATNRIRVGCNRPLACGRPAPRGSISSAASTTGPITSPSSSSRGQAPFLTAATGRVPYSCAERETACPCTPAAVLPELMPLLVPRRLPTPPLTSSGPG